MDKRTKFYHSVTQLSLLIGGILLGSLLNEYKHYLSKPKWIDQQVKLQGTGFISPVSLEELNGFIVYAKEEPEPAKEPEPVQTSIDEIVSIVRRLESSNGTAGLAVTCKEKGLSNEYGYNPPKCYESHEQLTEIVKNWFERKLQTMSLEESLCLYNTGNKLQDCEYFKNFNKLKYEKN